VTESGQLGKLVRDFRFGKHVSSKSFSKALVAGAARGIGRGETRRQPRQCARFLRPTRCAHL